VELHVRNLWTVGITAAKNPVTRVNVESAQRYVESCESLGMYRCETVKDWLLIRPSLPDHHLCPLPCHAPSSCFETEPCQALVTMTCSCGRIKQATHCGRSSLNLSPDRPNLKCSSECAVGKRNAQLADALGLNSAKGITGSGLAGYASLVNTVSYTDELIRFARVHTKFLNTVEQTLAEFVSSQKKSQVLPQMSPDRRKFVHDVRRLFTPRCRMLMRNFLFS